MWQSLAPFVRTVYSRRILIYIGVFFFRCAVQNDMENSFAEQIFQMVFHCWLEHFRQEYRNHISNADKEGIHTVRFESVGSKKLYGFWCINIKLNCRGGCDWMDNQVKISFENLKTFYGQQNYGNANWKPQYELCHRNTHLSTAIYGTTTQLLLKQYDRILWHVSYFMALPTNCLCVHHHFRGFSHSFGLCIDFKLTLDNRNTLSWDATFILRIWLKKNVLCLNHWSWFTCI